MSHNSFVWLSGPPDSILSSPVEAMSSQPVLRWPMGMVPVELFHRIARELSREDVMNMRLVSREFEKNVSELFYRVVVVPFRAQIYLTNIARDDCVSSGKGKGKAEEMPGKKHRDGLQYDDYTNRTEKGLYDGMKVFKAYGHVIEKFAMTFEADEGKPLCNVLFNGHRIPKLPLQDKLSPFPLYTKESSPCLILNTTSKFIFRSFKQASRKRQIRNYYCFLGRVQVATFRIYSLRSLRISRKESGWYQPHGIRVFQPL